MRVAIVDDELLARSVLREYLARHDDIDIVAECANGFEAVKAIADLAPELVFLDIQMPRLDGFEVAELIGAKTRLIFVTAYDQYALKAFECHALDYLLKPFSEQRFDQALAHARAHRSLPETVLTLAREAATRSAPLDRVLIRDGAKVHVIASARIDYIEAQDDYISIRSEGKSYLKSQTLAELETQLDPAKFLRVHRSYLLNIDGIRRIEAATKDSHVAILRDDTRIPVSKAGYQKLRLLVG
ncbi:MULTISPECIES: LytTR family DNA-binding domain-containing protein [Janthinobacterium]|uniref:LytR/AlgR family response regulator transcription factor n=1 Tax=Janthinobacterium TaxID=29580 RepID=UPI001C5A7E5D|nr:MULTISPECIES: LytTR family transcriptional regulator DNA-binding domain-containing protein [Janthinobacterium]MBW3512604.1 LytTR family transcriptional regulator DNA-binding domain-containing protein [Janthinobacterium sp. NKUCC06_STL]MCA1858654.1 LytTR family transcriptional regulator DNA-binding domain-containing protein [Janthinobacterium lividum]